MVVRFKVKCAKIEWKTNSRRPSFLSKGISFLPRMQAMKKGINILILDLRSENEATLISHPKEANRPELETGEEGAEKKLRRDREVGLCLEALLHEVTRASERKELQAVNDDCTKWNTKFSNSNADWMVQEPTLFNSTLQANVSKKERLKKNQALDSELAKLKIQVKLTLRFTLYYECNIDLKVYMVRLEKRSIIDAKARQEEFEKVAVPAPEEFRVECDQIRGLQKGEIFVECLKAQQEEISQLKSLKLDIEGKIRTRVKVHNFLESQLAALNDQLGVARIEMQKWEKVAYDSTLENKELAKEMQESDHKMKEELMQKQVILETTGRQLGQLNNKINVVVEIQSEINQGKDRDAQDLTLKGRLIKKKAQKKVLKSTVKSLQEKLEQLVRETTMLRKV
eukprot:jgi/Bigna1/134671/aug1.26_g9379